MRGHIWKRCAARFESADCTEREISHEKAQEAQREVMRSRKMNFNEGVIQ